MEMHSKEVLNFNCLPNSSSERFIHWKLDNFCLYNVFPSLISCVLGTEHHRLNAFLNMSALCALH